MNESLHKREIVLEPLGKFSKLSFNNTISPPLPLTLFFLSNLTLTFLLTFRKHLTIAQRKMQLEKISLLLHKGDCRSPMCRSLLMDTIAATYIKSNAKRKKKLKAHKINREKGRETGRQRKQKRDNSSQVPFLGIGETWSHMSIPHYKLSPVQESDNENDYDDYDLL